MNMNSGIMCVVIMAVSVLSARYGREKRRSGVPVTPRDVARVMALAWAAGWAAIGLPALRATARYAPWSDLIPVGLALLALATAPLALVLAATWVASLYPAITAKKSKAPHPLDS